MILNLLKAFIRFPIFLWAWIRSKPASLELASSRLEVCCMCEDLDLLTRQCTHCWCFVRYKVQWQDEDCPKGKWKELTLQK
jgi:hypothetical protein